MKKFALVLAGGGSKGSYEVGAINALYELNYSFDIITGTSIGALNGAVLAQGQLDRLNILWDNLIASQILKNDVTQLKLSFNMNELIQSKNLLTSFFKDYAKEKGADITPFYALINDYLDYERLMQSPINYGCVSVEFPSLKPILMEKSQFTCKEDAFAYCLASASCFPAFPVATYKENKYIDGGYYDNLPIQFAFQMGAEQAVAIDLNKEINHLELALNPLVTTIIPSWDLGNFLDFNREHLDRNKQLGYLDVKKQLGHYWGFKYAFEKSKKNALFTAYAKALIRYNMIDEIKLLQANWYLPLQVKDYGIMAIEQLMQWFDYDPTHVYSLDAILNDINTFFEQYSTRHFNLSTIEELALNHHMNEIYILALNTMIQRENIEINLGIASKLIGNQIKTLQYVALFILLLMNRIK